MLIQDATLADGRVVDVRTKDGTIETVQSGLDPQDDERIIDADEKLLLPGAIDAHVHFRQPGFEHKETFETGSRSAAAGGVTTIVDQPNTEPPTTDGDAFDQKARFASDSYVDFGINGGVTESWDPESLLDRPLFALGEVFLADSTGEMGIDLELFGEAVAAATDRGVPVTVHAEDATMFDESQQSGDAGGIGIEANTDLWSAYRTAAAEEAAIERAVSVGQAHNAQIHIAHTSTPEGIDAAVSGGATCEVCPHHLFLSRDDLGSLGTFGRMNPPLRSEARRQAVFEKVADGTVDIIATDHAPHTETEKQQGVWDAPSGVPGVETMVPLLLAAAAEGHWSLERVRDLTAANPASIFGIETKGTIEPGYDADFALYDLSRTEQIRGKTLHTKCTWTPFEGMDGIFPELTVVRGSIVYERNPIAPPIDIDIDDVDAPSERFGDPVGQNVRQ